jgi:site-specific recombinase XerD
MQVSVDDRRTRGRRSFASNLLAKGSDIDTVQQLLRHVVELDHVMPYLEVSQTKLREMFEVAIWLYQHVDT